MKSNNLVTLATADKESGLEIKYQFQIPFVFVLMKEYWCKVMVKFSRG